MPQLIGTDAAEGGIQFHFGGVSRITPFETREALVNDDAGHRTGAVRQTGTVIAVLTDRIGQQIHPIAVDIPDQTGIFGETVGIGGNGITFIDRNQRALADGNLDILQFDISKNVIIRQVSHCFDLARYIRGLSARLPHNHTGFDAADGQVFRVGMEHRLGVVEQDLEVVVLVGHIVIHRRRHQADTLRTVEAFQINGALVTGVINRGSGQLLVLAGIASLVVADDDTFYDNVFVNGFAGLHILVFEFAHRHRRTDFFAGGTLNDIERKCDGLAPAIGKTETHRRRARIVLIVVLQGGDGHRTTCCRRIRYIDVRNPLF